MREVALQAPGAHGWLVGRAGPSRGFYMLLEGRDGTWAEVQTLEQGREVRRGLPLRLRVAAAPLPRPPGLVWSLAVAVAGGACEEGLGCSRAGAW